MPRSLGLLAFAAVGPALLGGLAPPPRPHPPAGELLDLMRQRLLAAHDVAAWKWNRTAPIADPAREEALLKATADAGTLHGLDPAFTRRFFAAQIEAGKLVQQADFDRWRGERRGPFPAPPDLTTVTRPRLDRIGRDLLAALARTGADPVSRSRLRRAAEGVLVGDGITPHVRGTALAPLLAHTR